MDLSTTISSPVSRIGVELAGVQPISKVAEPPCDDGRPPGHPDCDVLAAHAKKGVGRQVTQNVRDWRDIPIDVCPKVTIVPQFSVMAS